jgi:tetratricopeptide (TPR) repeat protein
VEQIDWSKKAVAWCQGRPEIPARVFARLLTFASGPLGQDDPPAAMLWLKQAAEILRGLGAAGKETLLSCLFFMGRSYLNDLDDVESAHACLNEVEAGILELGSNPAMPKEYPARMAFLTAAKAELAIKQGQYQEARRQAAEGVRLSREIGDRRGAEFALLNLAIARQNLGDYAQARDDLLQALNVLGDEQGYMRQNHESTVLHLLGVVDFQQGNLDRSLDYCHDSLRLADNIHDYNMIASCLSLSAGIAAKQGQPARAARLSGAAQALCERQGRKPLEDITLDTLLPGWREAPDCQAILTEYEAGRSLNAERAAEYALGANGGAFN